MKMDIYESINKISRNFKNLPTLRTLSEDAFEGYSEKAYEFTNIVTMVMGASPQKTDDITNILPSIRDTLERIYSLGDDINVYILFDELAPFLEKKGLYAEAAWAYCWVILCYRNFSLWEEAEDVSKRTFSLLEEHCPDHPIIIGLINITGQIYSLMHRWDDARDFFKKSIKIAEKTDSETLKNVLGYDRDTAVATRLINLMDLSMRHARTLPQYERAPLIMEAEGYLEELLKTPQTPDRAFLTRINYGELLHLQGRSDEAKRHFLTLRDENNKSSDVARRRGEIYRNLAMIEADMGNSLRAYESCHQALTASMEGCCGIDEKAAIDDTIQILSQLHKEESIKNEDELIGFFVRDGKTIIQDLVDLLEMKDWYTGGGHSRAVSKISSLMGETILSDTFLSRTSTTDQDDVDLPTLRVAGLLHDIGKLSIPWSLLNKIYPIGDKERFILQRHSEEGAVLLRGLGFKKMAQLVVEHHEKLDGSGYPNKKREVSIMGAIIAVADVYEALITPNRRYKNPKSKIDALRELTELSGIQYHPSAIKALQEISEG